MKTATSRPHRFSRIFNTVVTLLVTSLVFSGAAHAGIFDPLVSAGCNVYKELTGSVAYMLIGLSATFIVINQLVGEARGVFGQVFPFVLWGTILVTLTAVLALMIPAARLPAACQ